MVSSQLIYFLDNRDSRYFCVEFPAKPSPAAIVGAPRMKVQYLGDVNDYRKYALLRLLADGGLKIGINWLLTGNDGRRDANKRSYLSQPDDWKAYDPDLFAILAKLPEAPTPHDLRQIEQQDIIPGAVYFELPVPCGAAAREAYHVSSMQALTACDLIFFDPDNGLTPASVSKARAAGVKFVFDDELASHYEAGRSLLVYQHFPRVERTGFLDGLGSRLRRFAPGAEIWACYTSNVVFMLVGNSNQIMARNGDLSMTIKKGQAHWPESFIKFMKVENVQR
jgi:hypothetical protein